MAVDPVLIPDFSNVSTAIAADLVGGNYYQYLKLAYGSDGTATVVESASGLPVALVASSATQPIAPVKSANATVSRVASNGSTKVTLLAASATRLGGSGYNDSTATLYVKAGDNPTATSKSAAIAPGAFFFVFPLYQGLITSAHSALNGAIDVTDYQP